MDIKLKVCGMREEDNINELLAIKPDYIGFIFYKQSKRYFGNDLQFISKISAALKVAVFVNGTMEEVTKTIWQGKFDGIQLHGNESSEYCNNLKQVLTDITIIKAFSIDESFDFSITKEYKDVCSYFLFDTKTPAHGGSGQSFNWEILKKYDNEIPYFLSGGIGMEEIHEIIKLKKNGYNIYAVDVNSKVEVAPGIKDIQKIKKIKEMLVH